VAELPTSAERTSAGKNRDGTHERHDDVRISEEKSQQAIYQQHRAVPELNIAA